VIGAFYGFGKNVFTKIEDLWEGVFSIIAALIITVMGAAMLRVSKLQDKWRLKIAHAIETKNKSETKWTRRFTHHAQKYALFWLAFVTVMREGLEAVIFIGGVGLSNPASAFPLPVITGLLAGAIIGYIIYKSAYPTRFVAQANCYL
jgi:high-affinity iron transporter